MNDFDDKIRQKLEGAEVGMNPKHWGAMESLLDSQPVPVAAVRFPWAIMLSLSLVVLINSASQIDSMRTTGMHEILMHEAKVEPTPDAAHTQAALRTSLQRPIDHPRTAHAKSAQPSSLLNSTPPGSGDGSVGSQTSPSSPSSIVPSHPTKQSSAKPIYHKVEKVMHRSVKGLRHIPLSIDSVLSPNAPELTPMEWQLPQESPKRKGWNTLATLSSGLLYNVYDRSDNHELTSGTEIGLQWVKNDRWVISTGLRLHQRKYEIEDSPDFMPRPNTMDEFDQAKARLTTVSVPLSVGYRVKPMKRKPIFLTISGGAAANHVSKSRTDSLMRRWVYLPAVSGTEFSRDHAIPFEQSAVTTYDSHDQSFLVYPSLFAGISGQVAINDKLHLGVNLSYEKAFFIGRTRTEIVPNHLSLSTSIAYRIN